MALSFKKGSFAVTAAQGATQDITDVGFQPVAYLLWCSLESVTAEGYVIDQGQYYGMMADGGTNRTSGMVIRNANPTVCRTQTDNNSALLAAETAAAVVLALAHSAMLSNGFRVSVSVKSAGVNTLVHYVALGGTDITNVLLTAQSDPGAAGTQTYSGATFTPDAILMLHLGFGTFSIGTAVSATKRWCSAISGNNGATCTTTADIKRYQRTDSIILGMDTGGAEQDRADFTGFTSTGFTLNWTVSAAAGLNQLFLLLKTGGQVDVGALNKSVAAQPVTDTITPSIAGTTPVGALFCSFGLAATNSISADSDQSFGASDGTNEGHVWGSGIDQNITADAAAGRFVTTKAIGLSSGPSTTDAEADCTLTSTTINLNWTTNNAVAVEVLWMAFGSPVIAPPDSPAVPQLRKMSLRPRMTVPGLAR